MATSEPLQTTLAVDSSAVPPTSPSYSPAASPSPSGRDEDIPSLDDEDSSGGEAQEEGPRMPPFRGGVSIEALTQPPWDFKMSPAHVESVATAPILSGDLPTVEMRRLDVGQRSAVGDLQAAVRNLSDLAHAATAVGPTTAPINRGAMRAARRERKLLERRVRSSAMRLWKLIRREDSRWTDLAVASSSSVDRQRLMFGALRAQESRLTSGQ